MYVLRLSILVPALFILLCFFRLYVDFAARREGERSISYCLVLPMKNERSFGTAKRLDRPRAGQSAIRD